MEIRRFIAKILFNLYCKLSRNYIIGVAGEDIKSGDVMSLRENDLVFFRAKVEDSY